MRGIFSTGEQSFEQRANERGTTRPFPDRSSFFKKILTGPRAVRAELSTRGPRALAAADLLSRHAWTTRELDARGCAGAARRADVAAAVVADLVARGYLDDAAFARHWVATRAERAATVPPACAPELVARGVATPLIDAALAGATTADALERARAVARRRLPALQRADRARAAARLRDHLLRRGYAASIVAQVVRECVGARLDD